MRYVRCLLAALGLGACATSGVQPSGGAAVRFPYIMCRPYLELADARSPAGAEADAHFERALAEQAARRYAAAAESFIRSARAHRKDTLGRQALVNRRLAYANAVNCWLSAEDEERARAALAAAQAEDPELAAVLGAWAAELPRPARCVDRTP